MGPCQCQWDWPFLPLPMNVGLKVLWRTAGPHGMALGPAPWWQDTQQVWGYGNKLWAMAQLAMASCLIQRGMASVAKVIWSRVKSKPDPAWRWVSCLCWHLTVGFCPCPFGRAPRIVFHHHRPRKASGLCWELSGAGEATISSCLFWLLISFHWLKLCNSFLTWICLELSPSHRLLLFFSPLD